MSSACCASDAAWSAELLEPGHGQLALVGVEGLDTADAITIEEDEYDEWKLNRRPLGGRPLHDDVGQDAQAECERISAGSSQRSGTSDANVRIDEM